jgi:ribose transport system permease protein
MLVAMIAAFSAWTPSFFSLANLTNVALQSSILAMLALPMTLVVMSEGIDLSVGSTASLVGVAFALVTLGTGSVALGAISGVLTGLLVGVINGWLIAVHALPPFVVTLATLGIVQGASLLIAEGQVTNGLPPVAHWLYDGAVLGVPTPIVGAALTYVLFHRLLYHTRFGGYVFALGGNREALQVSGVGIRRWLVAAYAMGGTFAAFAGLVLAARIDGGQPTAAASMEFDAIAAVVVGGTSFDKGKGGLPGTLLGVIAVGVLKNGLNLASVASAIQVTMIGLFVILAVLVDGRRPA